MFTLPSSITSIVLLLISCSSIWENHLDFIVNTLIIIASCVLMSLSTSVKDTVNLMGEEDYNVLD